MFALEQEQENLIYLCLAFAVSFLWLRYDVFEGKMCLGVYLETDDCIEKDGLPASGGLALNKS